MDSWVPVAFAAVIVIGAVGGQLIQMTLKELLPLLRTIAEQKQRQMAAPAEGEVLRRLAALEEKLEQVEGGVARLEEDREFQRRLLER